MTQRFFKISCVILISLLIGCQESGVHKTITKTDANGFTYETVTGDPLKARVYTLENGLKVYLAQNHDQPKLMTMIGVRTGSKHDPRETTGLAHYFEHIMFKGTDEVGTLNWEEESQLIAQISDLFELRKETEDETEKAEIYKKIDSLSLVASTKCVANEYDKAVSLLGARYTNAFTSFEETAYMNEVPSNELQRWLHLERERFEDPVMRLFHTELETVYEEFNMSQDNDYSTAFYATYGTLFKNHPYGVAVLGYGEHLKNPSMVNIQNFKDTYYVANNMAICLMGDLDFEETIKIIDEEWGTFASNPDLPEFTFEPEVEITEIIEKDVYGPDREFMNIAYRTKNNKSQDAKYLRLIDMILNNAEAGLIDLDLVKSQKVLRAYSSYNAMNDYGVFQLSGYARDGQELAEVKDLLLAEIDKIKTGEFEDWLIEAVINDFKLRELRRSESNWSVFNLHDAFVTGKQWEDIVKEIDELEKVTKEELVQFANEFFKENYIVVYKRNGENKDKMLVEKPSISPFDVNRDQESDFMANLKATETEDLKPVFLDFENSIQKENLSDDIEYFYTKNPTNQFASLYYIVDMGKDHNTMLPLAVNYLKYIGTDTYSLDELSKEFYKIGITFRVFSGNDRCYISINGLDENIDKGIELLEHTLASPKADQEAYDKYVEGILKDRKDAKLNKSQILWSGMQNYAKYGKESSFTNILSEEELRDVDPESLITEIKNLLNYKHRVVYYGPRNKEDAKSAILAQHTVDKEFMDIPEITKYKELDIDKSQVFFCDYDMVQAQIILLAKDKTFDAAEMPQIRMFNSYYGGSMASIIFQEMREARGLAYSAYAGYSTPGELDKSNYIFGFIATQPDKIETALDKFNELLNEMPESEKAFSASQNAIIKQINAERIIKDQVFWTYLRNSDIGITHDYRQDIYNHAQNSDLTDLKEFFDNTIKGNEYNILVLGNKNSVDFNMLSKYGKVTELTLEEVFNY